MRSRISSLRPLFGLALFALPFAVGCSTTGLEVGDLPTDGSVDGDAPDAACASGKLACGDAGCVDPSFDPHNCGGCGVACGTGEVCSAGKCAASCGAPLVQCTSGTGSVCVDPLHDPTNCGKCGVKCLDGEVCAKGGCAIECPTDLEKCSTKCVDTKIDPTNCGGCGKACGVEQVCVAGKCSDTCSSPLIKCTSFCVNPGYDPNNCGKCGVKCPAGTACVEGACGSSDLTDDDKDTISNYHEGKSDRIDTDKDGTPDYLDLDSDDDTIPDFKEAGDDNVVTPPVDTDFDGTPDFRDTDSDNDGLSDKDEVTKYKTDPKKQDTDGDGYTDAEEIAAGTDPLDAASNPGTISGFSFDLPYKALPRTQELTFRPQIKKADVIFVVDTTGSMGGSISGIQTSLKSIAASLVTKIPDTAFGVGDHKDMPTGGYGDPSDWPFKQRQRVTTSLTDAQNGVNLLSASGGSDISEAQIEGLYQAATGNGFRGPTGTVWTPKFDATVGFDASKGHGKIGGMGFRTDSAPVFILATDASFHHAPGDTAAPDASGGTAQYSATFFGTTADQTPHTVSQTIDAITGIGGKFIGIEVSSGFGGPGGDNPRKQEEYFALKTGAVTKSADGATCPNGIGGAAVPAVPDATGTKVCPLVFSSPSSGTGIDTAIVDAIGKLATAVDFKTVWLEARDNTTTPLDETKFFKKGIPVSFGTPLPAGCSAPSIGDLLPLPTGDGTYDSFTSLCPGTIVTFALVMQNVDVPAKCEDQVFSFKIVVIGDKTVETDARVVTVRVPGVIGMCPGH